MDPTWTNQAQLVRHRQLSDWGLQVCVELMVYATSLLLVLICVVASVRTIFWALSGSCARRAARYQEVTQAVLDGEDEEAQRAVMSSPPPPPPMPPSTGHKEAEVSASSKQPVLSTVHIESHSQQAGNLTPFIKFARLKNVLSQSARSPNAASQSVGSAVDGAVSGGSALGGAVYHHSGAVYHATVTDNPMVARGVKRQDKTLTRDSAPAAHRYWGHRLVCPRGLPDKPLMGLGWVGEPVAVHYSSSRPVC